ncbi:MAG: hypothetical protein DME26_06895 [Verrucomicrobia bacterium]|nr:MAG: hypothetical protein DME26_06895 [Verrucomicrobiota bacterium]
MIADIGGLSLCAILVPCCATFADERSPARHPEERGAAATLIHRADIVRDRSTNSTSPIRRGGLRGFDGDSSPNLMKIIGSNRARL